MNSTSKSKTACVILSWGEKYKKLSKVAKDSFVKHNPEVDVYLIDDSNLSSYESHSLLNKISIGVMKYALAHEIMKRERYKKIIVLGSDTITCSRLDEFLDNDEEDILATLDYPYKLITSRVESPDSETHINADVVCFNNQEAISDIVRVSQFHHTYHEQGGLNEIVWTSNKYKTKIVDYPYNESSVVYNARAKGNVAASAGQKPWPTYVQQYYTKEEKLYTHDNKHIKVFHYCDGLGGLSENAFYDLVNWWIFTCFNEETKKFFKNHCAAGDFFEKECTK
jgi:hypothetical protein